MSGAAPSKRKARTDPRASDTGPEPPDAAELYLVPEVLGLIARTPAAAA